MLSTEQSFQEDPERNATRALMEQWELHLGTSKAFKTSEIIASADEKMTNPVAGNGQPEWVYVRPDLRELLVGMAGDRRGGIDAGQFGNKLRDLKGKVYGGLRIVTVTKSESHGNRWQLDKLGPTNQG